MSSDCVHGNYCISIRAWAADDDSCSLDERLWALDLGLQDAFSLGALICFTRVTEWIPPMYLDPYQPSIFVSHRNLETAYTSISLIFRVLELP